MSKEKSTNRYPAELRTRGVRLFREHRSEYDSDNAAYIGVSSKLGCRSDTLRNWHKQAERDDGKLDTRINLDIASLYSF